MLILYLYSASISFKNKITKSFLEDTCIPAMNSLIRCTLRSVSGAIMVLRFKKLKVPCLGRTMINNVLMPTKLEIPTFCHIIVPMIAVCK